MPDEQDDNGPIVLPDPDLPAELLDKRIIDPKTPLHESIMLTRIRGEIIRQQEFRLDRDHARRKEIP